MQPEKTILGINDAADFLGLKKSYLYQLTSKKVIPHSKPNNKKIYFQKSDLERWALSGQAK